ncbi:MAG: 16S rRNA (guanine(527)-N(7))-methyltransferase RsmG [Eubacterium sp.]|nr:16S rRNA (guanine(527)-N(7))-methyltransferase RsmG [Eubacterium sp.]
MEKLMQLSNEMNIELSPETLSSFDSYYHMLIEKNKVMNLTAITEKDEVILKHFVDSISISAAVPEFLKLIGSGKAAKILDVGTGAGFPGIPLKIAFPEANITLLDSLNKRVLFLQEVIDSLGLKKITAIHDRAEDAARKPELRGRFDIVVSRAVAALPILTEYTLPFLKEGGFLICYKTPEAEKELDEAAHAISVLGGGEGKIYEYTLPGSDITRSFIVIKKIKATPKAYPRKAGTAKKNPL